MTRQLVRLVVFLAMCSCLASCGMRVLVHDQTVAASSAAQFARTAYISKDFKTAHSMLAPQARASVTLDTLTDTIAKMHPNGYPDDVSAVEYEPLPGQAAMNIYLKGQNATETFYYRMLMVGDKASGYKVSYLARGSGPYPPSNRHPLR